MAEPFFSVVTPSWNQGAWIEGCIRSVLAQGVDDFEHIIFDNCSTDETPAVLAKFSHLQCHSEPDRGQADALNKAMYLSRGEVICWLNADDQYLPETFAILRREFARPGVDVVYGDAQEVFFDGRPPQVRRAKFRRREDFLFWWRKDVDLLQPAIFFRRRLLAEIGELREDLHLVMDTEFWWRLLRNHEFHYIAAPLAVQQRQPDSKTIKHVHRIYEEKAKVFEPLLHAAHPRARFSNTLARRRAMGGRYLQLAHSARGANPAAVPNLLSLSLRENPLLVFAPKWWQARLFPQAKIPAAL